MERVEKFISFIFSKKSKDTEDLYFDIKDNKPSTDDLIAMNALNRAKAKSVDDQYVSADLDRILKLINKEKSNKYSLTKLSKIASVIVVLLVCGYYFYVSNTITVVSPTIKITYTKYSTSEDEHSTITLADGSVISLKPNTHVLVPSDFSMENRNLKFEGEAYFEIFHNSKSVFNLESNNYKLRVLGTKFNVRSYNQEKYITTSLNVGKVEADFSSFTKNEKDKIVLKEYQKVIFDKTQKRAKLKMFDKQIKISWKNDLFVFYNKSFGELIENLSLYFNKEIVVVDKQLLNKKYSGEFKKKDLLQILYTLKSISPFEVEVKNDKLYITKDKYEKMIKKANKNFSRK
jgi:ferric-dicitrate binding protein FerR (iron transport regulator)